MRVIAATNRDLLALVHAGTFREDLYYRINVVNIHLAPIRERKEDIEPLVRYFIRRYAKEFNKPVADIDPAALKMLVEYAWPGNVREIRNCMERAVLLAEGEFIRPDDISVAAGQKGEEVSDQGQRLSSLANTEKELILDALKKHDWVQKDAAKALGISKRVMHYKIQKYGITHHRWLKNR